MFQFLMVVFVQNYNSGPAQVRASLKFPKYAMDIIFKLLPISQREKYPKYYARDWETIFAELETQKNPFSNFLEKSHSAEKGFSSRNFPQAAISYENVRAPSTK